MKKILTLVLGATLASSSFAGDIISAKDVEAILELAKGYGSARLEKDSGGDPKIVGRVDGTKYGIYFYGCNDNGEDCDDIQFAAGWGGDINVSMEQVNDWNKARRFGKAYLDNEGDPRLEMAVNIDYGVTQRNLDDSFNWWSKVLKRFKKDVLGQ